VSNWAYMVMTALAWNLKAWFALSVPEHPRHKEVHRAQKRGLLRMEFKTFVNAIILMPCQIIQGGHRLFVPAAVVERVAGCVLASGCMCCGAEGS